MYAKFCSENPHGKNTLGRPRRKWDGNIRMYLTQIVLEVVDWMHPAQGRDQRQGLVNIVMDFRVPYKPGNFLTS
jgi:hypothetical protein